MKQFLFSVFAFTLILSSGCKKDSADNGNNTEVQIRLQNATPFTIYNCKFDPTDGSHANTYNSNYGQIEIDSVTAYRVCKGAYRYGGFSATIDNRPYSLQPYDYVGETFLTSGKYTYKVIYAPATGGISMSVSKD